MLITRIEKGNGKRHRVFGNEQFLFSLYNQELKQFNIKENYDIDESIVTEILDTVIYKRARERALYLLERRPLSVHTMRDKLLQNEYPISVIDRVINFLIKYHYLDDLEYVSMYVHTYSSNKSKRQLEYNLKQKGIAKNIIDNYFTENDFSEQECFDKQYHRYIRGKNLQDYPTRQKVFQYFYRKGFSSSLIESYMNEYDT